MTFLCNFVLHKLESRLKILTFSYSVCVNCKWEIYLICWCSQNEWKIWESNIWTWLWCDWWIFPTPSHTLAKQTHSLSQFLKCKFKRSKQQKKDVLLIMISKKNCNKIIFCWYYITAPPAKFPYFLLSQKYFFYNITKNDAFSLYLFSYYSYLLTHSVGTITCLSPMLTSLEFMYFACQCVGVWMRET